MCPDIVIAVATHRFAILLSGLVLPIGSITRDNDTVADGGAYSKCMDENGFVARQRSAYALGVFHGIF